MIGIFVHDTRAIKYALAIVMGYKPIETRFRNMLRPCIGHRVAIIQTGFGWPQIVGYADITSASFCPAGQLDQFRDQTLIPPGSKFDSDTRGKWFYHMARPEACKPYPLPDTAIRHGRSWCEF